MNISHESIADHAPFVATGASLTVERTIDAISAHIDERHGVLLDPGEALFASVDMRVPTWSHGSAYYATMGYAVPGALGAGRHRRRARRAVGGDTAANRDPAARVAALPIRRLAFSTPMTTAVVRLAGSRSRCLRRANGNSLRRLVSSVGSGCCPK